jgi:uncharacterized protein
MGIIANNSQIYLVCAIKGAAMLIEFTVGNFTSFKDPVTLSMAAAKIHSRDRRLDENNTILVDDELTLLTSAAVYGPNACGKSNLVHAVNFMRQFVRQSSKDSQAEEPIPVERFRLSTETDNQPSFFEAVFLIDGLQYRYGFEVDAAKVISEWLYFVPKRQEVKLFERDLQGIYPNQSRFKEYRGLIEKTRSNALFLSVVAQFNGPISQKILNWFENVGVISGLSDLIYRDFTIERFLDTEFRSRIVELVRRLDVGIRDIRLANHKGEKTLQGAPANFRDLLVRWTEGSRFVLETVHEKYNAQGEVIAYESLNMDQHESDGTEKLFFLAGPLLDTLTKGMVLWIDEMEARLHPNMTGAIIGLFNSRDTNPKGAQLIFTTHDTNLLSVKKLRRDQVWFIEKDRLAASRLYSLVEFKIRNDDASLEEDYIRGRYGAVPHLGELQAAYKVENP